MKKYLLKLNNYKVKAGFYALLALMLVAFAAYKAINENTFTGKFEDLKANILIQE